MTTLTAEELIRELPKGLLSWYEFKQDGAALYIGEVEEALAELLEDKGLQVVTASVEQICDKDFLQRYHQRFDYVVSVEDPELQAHPTDLLIAFSGLLNLDGRLLLGMNNRFGIRYFCGDRDPYTERNFDGIEGYRRAYSKNEDKFNGRCYSRSELKDMLNQAGFEHIRFYSVLSDLNNPFLIYAEDYMPNEDLATRIFPAYNYPRSVFLEEESLYRSLLDNGMFHAMANAYLVECALTGEFCDVNQVTCSMERGREKALITIIHRSGIVEKKAVYPEGQDRIQKLFEYGEDLREHGISVIDGKIENGAYLMPFVDAEVGQMYLKKLLLTDKEHFLQEMDKFRDLILQSSEIVEPDQGDGQGVVLRKGYLDMVPLNSFYIDGTFMVYDQEVCEENIPANVIIKRMITTFYAGNPELHKILPAGKLHERYGLIDNLDQWGKIERNFLTELRNDAELREYHEHCRRNGELVNANRQRLNYSAEDYDRLFVDIFNNADTRKLILFGSGKFAEKFLAMYSQDYPVYAVVDNNSERWGQELEGIVIQSPDILKELQNGEYKVLICIKNYLSVMKQLDNMGITAYSIYDSSKAYPRKRKPIVAIQGISSGDTAPKKYHTGYVAGVFDLFHIGHLNMFRRAKELCDYLIVGVVSDAGVSKYKEKETFIPFEERIEMVRSCRYVDEAVEIPLEYRGTREAWSLYHFDCQFSGSDYMDNPNWLANKRFLEEHGAEMVFFPYTEQTSSSKIKEMIEKKLL